MGNETVIRLPDSVRKAMLRDAGYAPEEWHPDAHFRREIPPEQPTSQPTLSTARETISPDAARIGKAMLGITDVGRGFIQ